MAFAVGLPARLSPSGGAGRFLLCLIVRYFRTCPNACSTRGVGYDKRPPPEPDRLTVASLLGAASRHAGWQHPTGEALVAAIAELQAIAGGRTDLLAEAAGICRGFQLSGHAGAEHDRIKADLLTAAGADEGLLEHWTEVGLERAKPKGTYPV